MSAKSAAFFDAVENRRSYYNLTNKSTLTNEQLQSLVEKAIKHAPTAFNGQQTRAVLVTGAHHIKVWETITEHYLKTLGGNKEAEEAATKKIATEFKAGYGTVLLFEDETVINGFAAKIPPLALKFPIWSQNSAGIAQHIIWTALELEGHGASLQHHTQVSPEIQAAITTLLDLPPTWISSALIPFGIPSGPPGRGADKVFSPIEDRVKVFIE
ncbi:hypothetical protein CI109_106875 [Kwoniella shandongensis]|uniref:Uncharacterized protein n=1 Tax=Kwoniella shandongensis TaxID=1734106 RepID=A0A5M6CC64_9TREE|nr:uncharacterized protein CI109_000869 [Kwoniella shandongensis]KAA5530689.1 hypothetical protein CI109_000869 [Kwoniella shandongensis]